jgi:hypothetical protein
VERLTYLFESIDSLMKSCDIDFELLLKMPRDESLFTDYENQRVVNSFLFNYMKIQDKSVRSFSELFFSNSGKLMMTVSR